MKAARFALLALVVILSLAALAFPGEMPAEAKKKFNALINSTDPARRAEAVALLPEAKESKALKLLLALFEREREDEVIEAAYKVMKGFTEESVIHSACKAATKVRLADRRAGFMRVLWSYGNDKAFETVLKHLNDSAWEVRMTVAELLAETFKDKGLDKTKKAIRNLINRLPRETDKRTQKLVRAALYWLTGEDLGIDKKKWGAWWKENGEAYAGPKGGAPEPVDKDGDGKPDLITVVEKPAPKATGPLPKFFGHELKKKRLAFVIDISGSMGEAPGGNSKLQIVKDELVRAIGAFDKTYRFNMFFYSTGVFMWKDCLQKATEEIKKEAIDYLNGLRPLQLTNIGAALQKAADDGDTDTLILLTDGHPTIGITDKEALLKFVRSWNKFKKIKINTVGMAGADAAFLQKLAEQNGGKYTTAP